MGLWWALVAGLAETAAIGIQILCYGYSYLGSLQMHRYALWAIGVSDILIVSAGVVVLGLLAWAIPGKQTIRFCFWLQATGAGLAFLFAFRSLAPISAAILACGLASVCSRKVNLSGPRYRQFLAWTYPVLLMTPIGFYTWQTGADAWREFLQIAALPASKSGQPNILLIVLDTVRADAMSCYGYGRVTTPHLDRLAARGSRFANARAPGTWTLPSHSSMFTGRWPHELSARINRPLDGTFPTLAEAMMQQGYATAGFVGNTFFCNTWHGLARGFIHYADTPLRIQTILRSSGIGRKLLKSLGLNNREVERPKAVFGRKNASTINQEFLGWLDQRNLDRPFFAFLNYFDAHDPYLVEFEPAQPFGLRPRTPEERYLLRDWHLADMSKVTPQQVQMARDCYDDCLAELDRGLGRMLERLESRGLARTTWIVVTSDHGEAFGEHGRFGHGNSLHQQVTHVPLLIIPPLEDAPGTPSVINTPVSLRDLPATIMDLVGVDSETAFPGSSLRQLWDSSASTKPLSPVLTEIVDREKSDPSSWKTGASVISDGLTYLRSVDGVESLYDLLADPRETNNLSSLSQHQEQLARLRALVKSYVPANPDDPRQIEDDDVDDD